MNNIVTHEIKLEKSVLIILGILVFGILFNVFNSKDFVIRDAITKTLGRKLSGKLYTNRYGNIELLQWTNQ